jgi:hypothetical protein
VRLTPTPGRRRLPAIRSPTTSAPARHSLSSRRATPTARCARWKASGRDRPWGGWRRR